MSRAKLAFREQLDSVPIRNPRAQATREADGTLTLSMEVAPPAWMRPLRRWIRIPPPTTRYRLDRVGTEVFESIDGAKTFEALIDEFAARHKLMFFESRALLVIYVQLLMKRGVIGIGVPSQPRRT